MAQLQRLAIAPTQIHQQQITLTPQQHHYLSRVLRLRQGDRFIAIDGKGNWLLANLAGTSAEILEQLSIETELPVTVTLMVALPKGNGFDEIVRCCTELGVAVIMPVMSDRTLLNPSPQKLERWRRIATEAAEQSERQIVPTILDPLAFSAGLSFCQEQLHEELVKNHQYICVTRRDCVNLLECLQLKVDGNSDYSQSIVIATGCEGGWTDAEVESAIAHNFQPVSLGHRILRAVTAPIVAMSLIAAATEKI
ncbi:Ribosomal RNA small subunit methyltransferase E [Crinalium epipsammum PCC 9333]|uniref:Ribosomal RNA small subunit methyltransferase E n=1 Tax=Crinalium epipsammum PCC 9333 TaxID=1173022 RepID=K9VZU4_9CYAN|nr:16S rRNA (uracil(1498)-N(3))-methyltransferase [Crinalium epipsammum]AFZ13643.1 Ribosomal RNA small subunit methyltransferase E [Crinalium epipsammum PCC 9333]